MENSEVTPLPSCPIRGRLTGVKRSIFNPNLPSLRRMEMDDLQHKLPEEHCRHSTRCTAKQFADAQNRPFKLPDSARQSCMSTVTGRGVISHFQTPEDIQESHRIWSRYVAEKKLDPSTGSFKENLDRLFSKKELIDHWHFDGVMLRTIKPEVRDWRYTFKCEPGMHHIRKVQRVTPSDISNRHRHLEPPTCNYGEGAVCNRK